MLLRTGGLPALGYCQAHTGVSNTHLLGQRRSVAAAGVAAGAGDLDLTLAMIDGSLHGMADPAFAAHSDPIATCAKAVWCASIPIHMFVKLISKALLLPTNDLREATNTWARVRGPAAAFVASAQRLGWQIISACM